MLVLHAEWLHTGGLLLVLHASWLVLHAGGLHTGGLVLYAGGLHAGGLMLVLHARRLHAGR